MILYDHLHYPSSPSSSSSPTTSFSRPNSPLHRQRKLPHHHNTLTRQHKGDDHQDVSRLLDPAYAPHDFLHHQQGHHNEAYVDRFGALHDPDYRYFPPAPAPSPLHLEEGLGEDEDGYESFDAHLQQLSSHLHQPERSLSPFFPYSPPTSFDSDDTWFPEEDEEETRMRDGGEVEEKEKERWCPVRAVRRRETREKEERRDDDDDERHGDHEWTPTCAESLKRQWQSMSFSFRLGVFRIKRRLRVKILGR